MSVASSQSHPGHILKIPSMTYVHREPPASARGQRTFIRRPPDLGHSLFPPTREQQPTHYTSIASIMNRATFPLILMSHCMLSTISAMILPSQLSQDPNYFLIPSTQVHFEDEKRLDNEENEAYPDEYIPSNEEILEALLVVGTKR